MVRTLQFIKLVLYFKLKKGRWAEGRNTSPTLPIDFPVKTKVISFIIACTLTKINRSTAHRGNILCPLFFRLDCTPLHGQTVPERFLNGF